MNFEEILRMIEEIKWDFNCWKVIIDVFCVFWVICCVLFGIVGFYNCVCKFFFLRDFFVEGLGIERVVVNGLEKRVNLSIVVF